MNGPSRLYQHLAELGIQFAYYEHPPVPTVEEARRYWVDIDACHCKNLFFRNHKGNAHYLVILDHRRDLSIRDLEQRLRQGKLSFASPERMERYLGLKPGSVSLFGLINDPMHEVIVFLDKNLESCHRISFHPNSNDASLVISGAEFHRFLQHSGNRFEFITLYDDPA